MSRGSRCTCSKEARKWVVEVRYGNYSAFSGYRFTRSDYSQVRCLTCRSIWRTKARYVDSLPSGTLPASGS